ncbi:STAS domain-containing protein [Kitasatospora sp. LaBMicrA B282]|uniref:STAS domain-containing protein n=1 Tax=Kitasatospora sp. LaBMicrA B282 TaxID=3420949 RepID=UPI003D1386C3
MPLSVSVSTSRDTATIELVGELDAASAPAFHDTIEQAAAAGVSTVLIRAHALTYLASAGLRSLVFARQKMGDQVTITVAGACAPVARTIRQAGFDRGLTLTEE